MDTPRIQRGGTGPVRRPDNSFARDTAWLDLRLPAPPDEPLIFADVVVTNPVANSVAGHAASEDGWAAEGAAKRKHARDPPGPRIRGHLVPLAVEAFGRWGKEARKFLRHAASRASQRGEFTGYSVAAGALIAGRWLQELSVTLQKGNAAMIRSATGCTGAWDVLAPEDLKWLSPDQVQDILTRYEGFVAAGDEDGLCVTVV